MAPRGGAVGEAVQADHQWSGTVVDRRRRGAGELHVADWGKPASAVMQACSYPMRILDGFDRTRDNIEGRLPALFEQGGLRAAATRGEASTLYGTLAFYSARRP